MKIAQVNVYFYPAMVGGAEWYVYNISRELVKRGHEVHVYTVDNCEGKKIRPLEDKVEGIYVHRLPQWIDLSYRARIWKGLKTRLLRENFDIIHTYDYAQPHSYTAIKAAKSAKIAAALTVFDVHSLVPHPFYKHIYMELFDSFLAKFTLRNADRILARAPNLIDPLIAMGASKEKIHVTSSGVIEEALEPANGESFLNKYSIVGRPVILFLARLRPQKGPQHLLMAAPSILERYPEAVFIFVGSEWATYRTVLVRLSERLNIAKNVLFMGPIYDFQEKMQALASCDVFVLPSGFEGTSASIFEAMAQARPIVTTNRGGIPFQVEHEKEAILIEYGDEKALASAVLRLLDERELAIKLGKNARERVKSFTYPILAEKIEGIYREMLGNRFR